MKSFVNKSAGVLCFLFVVRLCCAVPAPAGEKTLLRVGFVPLLSQLPLVVSYENDRLTFTGIDVALSSYSSFTSMEAALRVGALDMAALPLPIALSMAADRSPIHIIGSLHGGGSRLLSRTPMDLSGIRGKLVGVPGLDSNENLRLARVLAPMNLRYGLEFKTIEVSLDTAVADLKTGKIGAVYLPEPIGTKAELQGVASEVKGQEDLLTGGLCTVLVVRANTLKNSGEAVMEFLTSLVGSCGFIEKDIALSGARQVAILQKGFFNLEEEVVTRSLTLRRGAVRSGEPLPIWRR